MYPYLFLAEELVPGVTAAFALKTDFYIETKEFIGRCDFWFGRNCVILLFFVAAYMLDFFVNLVDQIPQKLMCVSLLISSKFGCFGVYGQLESTCCCSSLTMMCMKVFINLTERGNQAVTLTKGHERVHKGRNRIEHLQ